MKHSRTLFKAIVVFAIGAVAHRRCQHAEQLEHLAFEKCRGVLDADSFQCSLGEVS